MENKEDVKLEKETMMQNSFEVNSNLNDKDPDPKLSNIQSKRRFMITDILNSAAENANKEQKTGLDMRLLFPGVTRLHYQAHDQFHQKLHSPDIEDEADSDNEADDGQDDGDDKGKLSFY